MTLRILVNEDSAEDYDLLLAELSRNFPGFESRRVWEPEDLVRELGGFGPTLVVSDYYLPRYDGLDAYRLVRQHAPRLPFIMLTGTLNDAAAVECMKQGVDDYVLKEQIVRITPAIRGALERHRSEEERRRAQRERERFFNLTNDLFGIAAADGRFEELNPAWGESLGYSPEELRQGRFGDFVHEPDRPAAEEAWRRLAEDQTLTNLELRMRASDGSLRHILWSARPFLSERLFYLAGRDITDRKLAEEAARESESRMRQAQKLEAIGLLAGSVSHDFNNLLTAVRCYGEMLIDELRLAPPSTVEKVEEILKAASRGTALTRQLLSFSRKQEVRPQPLEVDNVVLGIRDMLATLLSASVPLQTDLRSGKAAVEADRNQLEQILVNLAVNARDAMPAGGSLTIRTFPTQIPATPRTGRLAELSPGSYIVLSVTDTGSGIPTEVRTRLFEPFFTTKEPGRGTGLGLATCLGIARSFGGAMDFQTEIGRGTTFEVYLPQLVVAQSLFDYEEEAERLDGAESILLVEDEAAVRAVAADILRSFGYEVREAGSGPEGLHLLAAEGAGMDLLITDLMMPGMGGRELAKRFRERCPRGNVLFISGYTDESSPDYDPLAASEPFLEKPFDRMMLGRKVRRILDRAERP